jgi:4'-phosphopantetheinyl transferase
MYNIFFNLSHSGKWILCGVGDKNIGLDVEIIKEINLNVAKRFYADEEYYSIIAVSKYEQQRLFYRYWTLKESYIKAEGLGLSIPLNSFSFQIGINNICMFVDGQQKEKYNFLISEIDQLHTTAVCWNGDNEELFHTKFQKVNLLQILQ